MTTRALPHLLLSALLVLTAIGLSLTAGTGALLDLGMIAVAVAITLVGLVRFGSQFVLIALLVPSAQKKIESAGATIVKPIFSFPGGRRFHFADPNGNELAVWSDVE